MPLTADERKRRTDAIEVSLKDGFAPHKQYGGRGSSIAEAARRLGNVKRQTLQCQIEDGTLKPDWGLYIPPDVPDGFKVTGRSTLVDMTTGEPRLEWIKTSADKERQEQMFQEALAAFSEKLPRVKPIKGPKSVSSDLMAVYPVGDHHLGMLSWAEETGADYDLQIGETLLAKATDHLIDSVQPCETAALIFLGDFLHYDSFESVTPANRNQLDSDTRFPKMVRAGIRSMRRMIERACEQHRHVKVIIEIGNHDISSSIFLMECMANIYDTNPAVTVDTSPRHYHYLRFGKNLIGTHHGHGTKMEQLPLIMASDRPDDWGSTEYRYWHTGHVHHDSTKDIQGCLVESHRILAPADAWAANKGYRSKRDMKAIVYHKDFGEVERVKFNPAMLNAIP
jgi:hypothetical protein